jgi:hypothetical protein
MSALAMQAHTFKVRPDIELQGHMKHGHNRIELAREELAERALAGGAEHILWLDDDQTFPPDTLLRLLAHTLPFVGANIRKRDPDNVVSASGQRRTSQFTGTRLAPTKPRPDGTEAVDLLGFGVTLTSAEIFRNLPQPWYIWRDGEERYFCEQAIRAGFHPHVDHALSREVGHIAETVLRFD